MSRRRDAWHDPIGRVVARRDADARLYAMLSKLPESEREALVLALDQGLSGQQIAERLNTTLEQLREDIKLSVEVEMMAADSDTDNASAPVVAAALEARIVKALPPAVGGIVDRTRRCEACGQALPEEPGPRTAGLNVCSQACCLALFLDDDPWYAYQLWNTYIGAPQIPMGCQKQHCPGIKTCAENRNYCKGRPTVIMGYCRGQWAVWPDSQFPIRSLTSPYAECSRVFDGKICTIGRDGDPDPQRSQPTRVCWSEEASGRWLRFATQHRFKGPIPSGTELLVATTDGGISTIASLDWIPGDLFIAATVEDL